MIFNCECILYFLVVLFKHWRKNIPEKTASICSCFAYIFYIPIFCQVIIFFFISMSIKNISPHKNRINILDSTNYIILLILDMFTSSNAFYYIIEKYLLRGKYRCMINNYKFQCDLYYITDILGFVCVAVNTERRFRSKLTWKICTYLYVHYIRKSKECSRIDIVWYH